jgi:hypothetical protein
MKVNNYQGWAKELFGNACYATCLSYLCRRCDDPIAITRDILNGVEKSYIGYDCYVSKPLEFIMLLTGLKYKDVKKVPISKISDIPSEPTIVEMLQPNGKDSHFVVCHFDGTKVVLDFDPSGISNSWKVQKFISYREFVR